MVTAYISAPAEETKDYRLESMNTSVDLKIEFADETERKRIKQYLQTIFAYIWRNKNVTVTFSDEEVRDGHKDSI